MYVLDDGGECDLDLGNYERFLDITLTSDSNITTGKIYKYVMDGERRGDYLGKTVQGILQCLTPPTVPALLCRLVPLVPRVCFCLCLALVYML